LDIIGVINLTAECPAVVISTKADIPNYQNNLAIAGTAIIMGRVNDWRVFRLIANFRVNPLSLSY
jgi:hypothetical protein